MSDYNSALQNILLNLALYDVHLREKDLLEKILSTFNTSNIILQQQYREHGFQTYEKLIAVLLAAKKNKEFLVRIMS